MIVVLTHMPAREAPALNHLTSAEAAVFLRGFMSDFRDHVARVLTVLPRSS